MISTLAVYIYVYTIYKIEILIFFSLMPYVNGDITIVRKFNDKFNHAGIATFCVPNSKTYNFQIYVCKMQ